MEKDSGNSWQRRDFLKLVCPSVLAASTLHSRDAIAASEEIAFPNSSEPDADRVFPQGIASGDPRPDGFLLWTRVPAESQTPVRFQISESKDFQKIVRAGDVIAHTDSDFTVRVQVEGLTANRRYWYRFHARGVSSPIGRTRTAPAAENDVPATVAFASCQDYIGRYYHAWRAVAERADEIDFVLFLGDYIYEYERYPDLQEPQEGRAIKLPDGLVIDEAKGVIAAQTLADYRTIYRATRSDPDLRRIHQLCPFVIIWDDHEHANDAWQDHAVDFNDRRGDEKDPGRRKAATRAWFEYLPVDVPYHPKEEFPSDIVTWRTMRWGRQLELVLTDQRYYRSDHVVPEGPVDRKVGKLLPNSPLGSRTLCIKDAFEEREAKARPTMLGEAQRDWFLASMKSSNARWKVWASALMVSPFVLDLRSFEKLPPAFRNVFYFKTDQWDGFPTERKQILGELAGIENLVVLSGDLHGFYAANLVRDADADKPEAIGTEFTVAGISSISLFEQVEAIIRSQPILKATGLGALAPGMDKNLLDSSRHFLHADSRGYGLAIAKFTKDRLDVEYLRITGVREREWNGQVESLRFWVKSGTPQVHVDGRSQS